MPTDTDIEALLKRKDVIPKKDGVGAYGLYVDFILHNKTTGKLVRQERYFLVSKLVCVYSRQAGKKRAAWRVYSLKNHDLAREQFVKMLDRREKSGFGIEMVHTPLLVEMTGADVEAIKKNEAPYGRFAAVTAAEKAVGKIDDDTWRAAAPVVDEAPPKLYSKVYKGETRTIAIDGVEYVVPETEMRDLRD